MQAQRSLRVTCAVDQIQLDPEDELTQNVDPANVAYYVFVNKTLMGVVTPARDASPDCSLVMSPEILNDPQAQLSLIARDVTQWLKSGAPIPEDESAPQVGTISLNTEYFRNVPVAQHGQTLTQWITLFDDQDDDEYDGDLGEDDEELPMLRSHFTVQVDQPLQESTPSPQKNSPPRVTPAAVVKQPSEATLKKPTPASTATLATTTATAAPPRASFTNLMSPIKNAKRKTVVTDAAGARHVVAAEAVGQVSPSSARGRYGARKNLKKTQ